ncbi:MAG: hypothetical protein K9L78_02405 [Victivallales bacterium]|nr:hypothetical protein [Victivallales bacterium]MCF7888947.1 hypothetical protein [Victivallales bacterium]
MKKIYNKILLLIIIIITLFCIYKIELKLNKIRKEKKLVESSVVYNAPPIIAFTTVALGGFRGIIADILWLRASLLQTQGKYFEMVQLASWISKLQPGFTGSTTFFAWNMAYNISVTFANPKDKYRWVENGLNLLIDAIKNTPNKIGLYSETAWLYLHKFGYVYDSSYKYYRYRLAKSMFKVTGTWHPDWKAYADIPENKEDMMLLLENKYNVKDTDISTFKLLEHLEKHDDLPDNFKSNLKSDKAANSVELFLRKMRLKNNFYMEPEKILKINSTLGLLDWNLWQAHAIYWLFNAPQKPLPKNREFVSFLFLALKQTLKNGKLLLFDKDNYKAIYTGPNLGIIKKSSEFLKRNILETEHKELYKQKYKIFIEEAIIQLFASGEFQQAEKLLKIIKKIYPEDKIYQNGLRSFINKAIPFKFFLHDKTAISALIKRNLKLSNIYKYRNDFKHSNGRRNFALFLYEAYNSSSPDDKLKSFYKFQKAAKVQKIEKYLIEH